MGEHAPLLQRRVLVGHRTEIIFQLALARLEGLALGGGDDNLPGEISVGEFLARAHAALVRIVLQGRTLPLSCPLNLCHQSSLRRCPVARAENRIHARLRATLSEPGCANSAASSFMNLINNATSPSGFPVAAS